MCHPLEPGPRTYGAQGRQAPQGGEGQLVAGGGGHPGDAPDGSELMRAVTASSVHTHMSGLLPDA